MFTLLRNQHPQGIRRFFNFLAPTCAVAFLLAAAVSAAAQIRLHDAGKDELAKKTRDAYAEFTREDNTVFDKMISNTLGLKEATLDHLMELNAQVRRDTINVIPVSTWKDLRERYVPRAQRQMLEAYQGSKRILAEDPNVPVPATLNAALADAKAELAARKLAMDAKKAALAQPEVDLASLKTTLDALKEAAVLSTKPVKNLTDLKAQFISLKAAWANVNEVRDWLEAAEKTANAPGLQLTILDLGVQHQQFVVQRLTLELEEAKAAHARAARIDQRLMLVWEDGSVDAKGRVTKGLFGQIYRYLTVPSDVRYPFVTDENEQVLQTIGRLAAIAEKETDGRRPDATMKLRDLMDVLSRYVSVIGYHQYLLLADAIEAGADKNLFSIRRSAINIREREMLVAHGLDGLTAYHAGGIKPEEVANFFRAAQSIAVGVLAGRR